MELNVERQIEKTNRSKYMLIIIPTIILILVFGYILIRLSNDNIHSNIKIMNINVSGMSKDDAVKKLKDYYSNNENEKLILSIDKTKQEVLFSDLNIIYYIEDAVSDAYKIGREGSFIKKVSEIIGTTIRGKVVQIPIKYNEDKLSGIISELESSIRIEPKNDGYEIINNSLVFNFGASGRGIDILKSIEQVEEKIKYGKGDKLVFKVINIESKEFDINSISENPKDASFKVANNKVEIIPEQYGVIVDKNAFSELLNSNKKEKKSFSIPAKVIEPNVNSKSLQEMIFRDELGSHETYYGNSTASRKENVSLSASKIGEIILAPGQEFSYNDVVGPRTPERGFKKAHVYSNGEVVDGYGGGICQTSTTLYNAVIKAKLEIVERKNHIFTVGYAPPGLDATVSYGTIDLRFKNNQDYPIKIVNETTSSKVIFKILGTKVNDNIVVEYRTEIIKTIPFEVEKTFDTTLAVGQNKVIQNGQNGYVVNVYKVIKQDGKVISDEFISRDSYWSLKEKVVVGTKPIIVGEETKNETTKNNEIIDIDENFIYDNIPVFEEYNPFDF